MTLSRGSRPADFDGDAQIAAACPDCPAFGRIGEAISAAAPQGAPVSRLPHSSATGSGSARAPDESAVGRRSAVLLVAESEASVLDGVSSPLAGLAERQRSALAANLGRRHLDVPVSLAWLATERSAFPAGERRQSVAGALEGLGRDGIDHVVALTLVPQFSTSTVCAACRMAEAALREDGSRAGGLAVDLVTDWHAEPRLVGAFASAVYEALDAVWAAGSSDRPGVDWALGSKMDTAVIFVAPLRRPGAAEDPYPGLVQDTAARIAGQLDLRSWTVAFVEPAGTTASAPPQADFVALRLPGAVRTIVARGETQAVVCPIGTVADGLDVLVAIDLEGRAAGSELGLTLERARSMNDDPTFIAALADVVQRRLAVPEVAEPRD